jgi:hypothetical protein
MSEHGLLGPATDAEARRTAMAKRRRPPMGIVVILVSLALGPWSAQADIDDLCKKTQCRRELCLTPKITGIMLFSNITPGGTVAVKGCGFGERGRSGWR